MYMFWGMIAVISLAAIITDYLSKKHKLNNESIDKQIELEKLKHENYLLETEKMKLELEKLQVEAPIFETRTRDSEKNT